MDFLEFGNLQQLLYTELARNVAESKNEADIQATVDLVKSSMSVRNEGRASEASNHDDGPVKERVFMSASRVNCHIGYAQLAMNLPSVHVEETFPTLLDVLNDIPDMDFDRSLVWERKSYSLTGWALPDQLSYSTVSALLRIASIYPEYRAEATSSVLKFSSRVVSQLQTEHPNFVLTQHAPSFHGFYRAIITSPFPWTALEWMRLVENLKSLFFPEVVDQLNDMLSESVKANEQDPEEARFIHIFLSRYVCQDRPLSGYFIVCCVMEIIWTVLAQCLSLPRIDSTSSDPNALEEAAAANRVWGRLMRKSIPGIEMSDVVREALEKASGYALRCFTDILVQIENMDTEPSLDTYAWETMSESLKLASVCSIARKELNEDLLGRLRLLLSEDSPVTDHLVQEAALKSTTVVVQNFPSIASLMSGHLRRFVTSPLPMFEYEFASESRAPPPLAAAAKCLALCIKLAPGDDFIMSNMYSLLNYISATSKDPLEGSLNSYNSPSSSFIPFDHNTVQSLRSGLQAFNDDQQRLIGISTISVVTCLTLEFESEEVTRLTVSMLLQRLRSAEPTVEAAIVYNLVDLALIAPENTFTDIIKAFSIINRSANPGDPRFSNNTIIAAQTRLAQELRRKPEYRGLYLVELLGLFIDKGVAIQNAAIASEQVKVDDLVEQLGALLLPIDALLSQETFQPHFEASLELLALFRNLWFLCVLFNLTNPLERGQSSADWQVAALTRIAIKTPPIVQEEIPDYVTSMLEYNTIIRQEYAHMATGRHRTSLGKLIAHRHSEIRYLNSAQLIFLLAMYHVEVMRSSAGYPSNLPTYFVNQSVNENENLIVCMESLCDKIIQVAIGELSRQVVEHSLPASVPEELRCLLASSCHRVAKVRDSALKYLNRLISSFPSLMCDEPLVFAILEALTILRRACEGEYLDEIDPVYEFHSELSQMNLQISDSYKIRNEMLSKLHSNANSWFALALARAPIEFQSTLQKYLSINQAKSFGDGPELGASVALQFATAIGPGERKISLISGISMWKPDRSRNVTKQIATKERVTGEIKGLSFYDTLAGEEPIVPPSELTYCGFTFLKENIERTYQEAQLRTLNISLSRLKELLFRCAAALVHTSHSDYDILHYVVALPFELFGPTVITVGVEIWTWIVAERPDLELQVIMELCAAWEKTIQNRVGLFSEHMDYEDPFMRAVEYSPTEKAEIDRISTSAQKMLAPHVLLLQMVLSRFQAARYRKPGLMLMILRLVLRCARSHQLMSTHPLAREARFSFLLFGFETLKSSKMDLYCETELRHALYSAAFSWFSVRPQWTYGANRIQVEADKKILTDFLSLLQTDAVRASHTISSMNNPSCKERHPGMKGANHLLRLLVDNEIYRLSVWDNPSNDPHRGIDHNGSTEKGIMDDSWVEEIRTAWKIDPALVVYLGERFKHAIVEKEVGRWIRTHSREFLDHPTALKYVVGEKLDQFLSRDLKFVLLWSPVAPITAITFFEPRYNNDSVLLQYAHRVLEQHPVDVTFFFVPQIVQSLRNDSLGYVKRFIFETAKISQLFCHQIIWNMKANCYRDDGATADPLKPHLDRMTDLVVTSLSGEAKSFYDREFGFFNEITSISGKLKPFIKKSRPEKKAKIDEEMAKIKVEVGVYLPSNPDGVVVDIDRKSGRPLQSHAKAPFMASFKVRKEQHVIEDTDSDLADTSSSVEIHRKKDVWLSAIFKVGDDCRQDVLALQVIAMFKNIFVSVGLNLYLFPYRVTATAPGCGVIDVVPNATSRDEMGRAKINDLLGFFIAKYGGEDSTAFQAARLNFIKSMAAYSVACYILQIKDRHNGNIMIDGEGHIVHIDFGFLFDIGGIKFEPNSFKLNHEMVVLMGGRYSQGYTLFQQLTVKAFLAIRPYADQIVSTVELMLGTELPSFKGEPTIRRLRERFALGLNERQAAEWMMGVVKNAHENMRSIAYDEFQRLQNGIPYK